MTKKEGQINSGMKIKWLKNNFLEHWAQNAGKRFFYFV